MSLTLDSFRGVGIVDDPRLAGFRYAVRVGSGPIHLSPAMYDLVTNADPGDVAAVLLHIPVVSVPSLPWLAAEEAAAFVPAAAFGEFPGGESC